MVRLYAVSGMMVLSMAATCAAQVETFTWEEGRFTILFADKPKVGQQVIKLPVGDVTMHIFTAEFPKQTGEMVVSYAGSDGKLTYTLKIQVTPDEALDEGKESVLAAARDKLAEEVGGKVVEESDAQIAGYEGHAYRLDVAGPKPVVVAARAAIVGKRTVVLYVIGDRAAAAGPSAERFLDSFQVDK
jgi:hypothetical protein